jgi:hypothetical protein
MHILEHYIIFHHSSAPNEFIGGPDGIAFVCVCEWRQARTQTISLVLAESALMPRIVSADSSHRARKEAAHIAERRLRVWGASDLLYYCQGNNTKYMPAVHARRAARENEREDYYASKEESSCLCAAGADFKY